MIQELHLTASEAYAFKVARTMVRCKSLRADARQGVYVVVNRILDRLAVEWGTEARLLAMMSTQELVAVVQGTTSLPSDLQARWEHSLAFPEGNAYRFVTGAEVDAFLVAHIITEERSKGEVLKGQTANPGKVTGPVKLVFGPHHNHKICDGDILVSPATSPQLLPAMKRAAAFVTDIGGITSHAAIVARELGKPCIVGTRVASKVFKDGDRVEVDADHGIVKRV